MAKAVHPSESFTSSSCMLHWFEVTKLTIIWGLVSTVSGSSAGDEKLHRISVADSGQIPAMLLFPQGCSVSSMRSAFSCSIASWRKMPRSTQGSRARAVRAWCWNYLNKPSFYHAKNQEKSGYHGNRWFFGSNSIYLYSCGILWNPVTADVGWWRGFKLNFTKWWR